MRNYALRWMADGEDNGDTRPLLRLVVGRDGAKSVQLHMPHLTYWSQAMPISEALALLERDIGLTPGWDGVVDVLADDRHQWPPHWPTLY